MPGGSIPEWLSHELAPYLELQREGRPVADLVHELTDAAIEGLRATALVMLRPEILRDGRALALLDHLEREHDIVAIRLSIRRADARLVDDVYATKLPLIAGGLRHHHRVLEDGPVAFVLVAGPAPVGQTLSVVLDELKGESTPSSEPGLSSLRSRFGRQSSFHSVVHTSEDAGDLLQGAVRVFGRDAVVPLLERTGRGEVDPVPRHALELLLGGAVTTPGCDVFQLALGIKRRILVVLDRSGPTAAIIDALDELYTSCHLDGSARFVDRRDRFIAMARRERPLLERLIALLEEQLADDVAAAAGTVVTAGRRWAVLDRIWSAPRLATASWWLSGHEPYELDDGRALVDLLAENSIVLSGWEQTLLAAALTCDINPASRFVGVRTYPLDPLPRTT